MSTRALAWEAIHPAPVVKTGLSEPEATTRHAPRPWLRWPPGSAFLLIAVSAMLFMAAFQTSVSVVRRDGISGGIADVEDGIQQQLPIDLPEIPALTLPAFVHPAKPVNVAVAAPAASAAGHHRRGHHHRGARLHLLLQENGGTTSGTTWSHDADATGAEP